MNIKRYLLEHEEEYSTLKEAYKVAKRYESIENAVLEEKQEFLSAAVGFGMRTTWQDEELRRGWYDVK